MTGIDTNVLVRYLVKDDPAQSKKAISLFKSLSLTSKGFISLIVIVETIWVLDSVYKQDLNLIRSAILKLLDSQKIVVQCANEIETALSGEGYEGSPSDAIIAEIGRAYGCAMTVTFDKKAAKFGYMKLL